MGLMHDFIILMGILSAPVDFFESIEDKILLISEPDTSLKENLGYLWVGFALFSGHWDVLPCCQCGNLCLYQWPHWQRKN